MSLLKILYVCSTNTSLSPLAVALASHQASALDISYRFTFESAGTHPGNTPRDPDRRVHELLRERGISCGSSQSQLIAAENVREAHYIFCMTEEHFWHVKELLSEDSRAQVYLVTHFTQQLGIREIADPLLGEGSYEQAAQWLDKCFEGFIRHLHTV